MSSNIIKKTKRGLAAAALLAWSGTSFGDWALNMPKGVTQNSEIMYDQHMFSLWVCVWIGVVVFGAMIWSIIKHRKSKGAVPANFHESTAIEIAWTIVPFLILIAFAVKATDGLMIVENNEKPGMTIKVTGYQWKWGYEYFRNNENKNDNNVKFISIRTKAHLDASLAGDMKKIKSFKDKNGKPIYLLDVDKPLVVPTGVKIRFLLTAGDVIHSWWIPDLGIKRDAIPGFVNATSITIPKGKEGTYRGNCAELCGRVHAFMPVVIVAKKKADFDTWYAKKQAEQKSLATKTWDEKSLVAHGKKIYASCVGCHQATGMGVPNVFPPLKGAAIANGKDATKHIKVVLNGSANKKMPGFASMSDEDLAAVITYERKSWGNKGSVVYPKDVKAARNK